MCGCWLVSNTASGLGNLTNVWHEASQGRARRGGREERKLAGIL